MNEIKMTVELCAEDRARLDKIIEGLTALGQHPDCSRCVKDVAGVMEKACECIDKADKTPKAQDDVQEALAEVVHGSKKTDPFPEASKAEAEPSEAGKEEMEEPTVTMEMLRSKAITLAAAGKKDQVREVVHPYAPKVTELPEDKWAEVYKKLCALEG